MRLLIATTPAKAGVHTPAAPAFAGWHCSAKEWVPAFAGMTADLAKVRKAVRSGGYW